MSRRTRTAALVSATTLLIGGSLSLGLASSASAAGLPDLATLTVDKSNPTIGETVFLSGTLCLGVDTKSNAAAAEATPAAGDAGDQPGSGDTGGNGDGSGDAPLAATVAITVTTPSGPTKDIATPDDAGTWTADAGVQITEAGTYTFNATCNSGLGLGGDYTAISVDVAEQAPTPTINVSPNAAEGGTVAPGGQVTITGTGFTGATKVDVSLTGVAPATAAVSDAGGFSGVSLIIPANQTSATLTGAVTPDGGLAPVSFTVVVVAPTPTSTPTSPSADGSVPPATDDSDTDYGSGYGSGYTASKPTLPNTGTDTLWPGVVGALLVLSGAGLVWSGRRREQAGTHAA